MATMEENELKSWKKVGDEMGKKTLKKGAKNMAVRPIFGQPEEGGRPGWPNGWLGRCVAQPVARP